MDQRRPDQSWEPPPTQLSPGGRINRFNKLIVIGAGGGEFVYDASSNLRSANVGQVTTDPINGITCQQGFTTFNGHGAAVNYLSTMAGNAAFIQYLDNGSAVQGTLILSVNSETSTFTEPYSSSTVQLGIEGVNPVFGSTFNSQGGSLLLSSTSLTLASQIGILNAPSSSQGPLLFVAGPEQTAAHHSEIILYGASPDGTSRTAQVWIGILAGSGSPTLVTDALLEISGSTALTDISAPASVAGASIAYSATGQLKYVSSDTNAYNTGRLSLIANSTTLINNTTPINITGLQFTNVAATTYRVDAIIRLTAAASGTVQPFAVRVNGSATVSSMLLQFTQWNAEGTPTAVLGITTALNTDPTHIIGTLGNSNVATFVIGGFVTFSGAGSFGFTARGTLAAGDETATVQTGSFADLMPAA